MKKKILDLLFVLTFLFINNVQAVPVSVSNQGAKTVVSQHFKRTFYESKINRLKKLNKKTNDISISFDDFSTHLAYGTDRITMATAIPLNMDIGAINSGTKETWILPDISSNSDFISVVQHHIPAAETDIFAVFGSGTHGIYSDEILERDDLYDLQTDKLTFVVYEEVIDGGDYNNDDDWKEYQYNQLRAAIPLELGLDYNSTAKFEEEGNPTNFIEYKDIYHVIGEGTLKTFDDGDADALKVIYKEETRTFENNIEVSYSERYEIIFYSKKGHYMYAEMENPWNNEDVVSLTKITYQRLQAKTASVNDESLSKINIFPNPINAGETLTITSQSLLNKAVVDFYTITGQKIATVGLQNTNNNSLVIPQKFATGLYFYKVKNENGALIQNGKIVVK